MLWHPSNLFQLWRKKSVPKIFSIGQYLGVALDPWSFNNTEINFKIDVMQTWKLLVPKCIILVY